MFKRETPISELLYLYLDAARGNDSQHLGYGDIRLSLKDQIELVERVRALEEGRA